MVGIIAEQRYVRKEDGKLWLQVKTVKNAYMDASGALNVARSEMSEWEDVPICYDDWSDDEPKPERTG